MKIMVFFFSFNSSRKHLRDFYSQKWPKTGLIYNSRNNEYSMNMWMWHVPDICICHVIGQHCFLWMTLLCVDQSEAYFRHAYAWMCVSLEKLVIGPSGFQTHDITSLSHKITSVTLVYHQRGVERYNFKLKNLQNAAEKSWMKNTTMIFIDKLQKHIKNKKIHDLGGMGL